MSAAVELPDCGVCGKPIEVDDHYALVCDHEGGGECGCLPVPVHPRCCPDCIDDLPLAPVVDLAERRARAGAAS